jgi:hypothetical protein
MEILKKIPLVVVAGLAMLALSGCAPGDTVSTTVSVPMGSDTYIATGSEVPHGGEPVLNVSHAGGIEERTLLPLPGDDDRDGQESFVEALFTGIFGAIFSDGCDRSKIIDPQYLKSAKLELTFTDAAMKTQATQLTLRPISRQWWQSATWTRAHPFTSSGQWQSAGGDIDSGSGFKTGVAGTDSEYGKVFFDVRDYVTSSYSWIPIKGVNGFIIQGSSGTDVSFHSAQSAWTESFRPHIDFEYEGPCVKTGTSSSY